MTFRTRVPLIVSLLVILLGWWPADRSEAQRFYPDDPLLEDQDRLSVPRPQEVERSGLFDVIDNTFFKRRDEIIRTATNVNTLNEVPDSTWFTNRIGVRALSLESLVRGPNTGTGPNTNAPLVIVAGKSGGISPGFTATDSRGDTYFIKFDPAEHPNLSTAADVIGTKFFYAIGYNVPENYIAYINRSRLRIGEGATVSEEGTRRAMREADIDAILSAAAHSSDGRVRVIASKALEGVPIGPFRFFGTRGDDPNDVFDHQSRRELRGYRLFCAWLNHDDSRGLNTLDTFIADDEDLGYVKHHLIDFSSTLGSGSNELRQIAPQHRRAGNEYLIELGPVFKTAASLGLWERPWRRTGYRYPEYAEIGRIESDVFNPEQWRPEYPNPAFQRMRPDDAYWAAKIVARFSDAAIRAIVAAGEYQDARASEFLAQTLIARRDKVVAFGFSRLSPLDDFRWHEDALYFTHLGEQSRLGTIGGYTYRWFSFDNASEEAAPLDERQQTEHARIPAPPVRTNANANANAGGRFRMVEIRALETSNLHWAQPVRIYFRDSKIVGVERDFE